jgi:hypothetical protein
MVEEKSSESSVKAASPVQRRSSRNQRRVAVVSNKSESEKDEEME